MTSSSLQFESPDLTSWLWIALGVLILCEGLRLAIPFRLATRPGWKMLGIVALILAGGAVLMRPGRGHLTPLIGIGAILVLWAIRSYRTTTRDISTMRRRLLIGLRAAAMFCLLAMLAGPVLQWTTQTRERSAMAVLLDDSASMRVRDVVTSDQSNAASLSRLEAVQAALRRSRDAIDRAGDVLDVHWIQFGEQTETVKSPRLMADATSTALLDAVGATQSRLGAMPQRLIGMIVISDGRDNGSSHPREQVAETLAAAGIPLYTIGVGSEVPAGQTRSLIARRLDCPAQVSLLNAFPVHAEFYAAGLSGSEIDLTFAYDGEVVHRQTVKPRGLGEAMSFDASHIPKSEGLHRVMVTARARGMEGPAGTASLSAFVQVINDQTLVLYLDRPRYERAAISRALAGSKDFQLVRMDVQPYQQRAELDWRAYSAVLLGDIDRDTLSPVEIERLRVAVVQAGRGVALLGGTRTVGSGGFSGSPLVELFGVDLGATGQIDEEVQAQPTPAGRLHPILQAPAGTPVISAWSLLPPFMGASRLTGSKPTAEILLQSPRGEALLVVQELGHGRSAVLAFDSTWRWSLGSDSGAEMQRRFWRQLVLWLTNRRPQVWVNVERPRYLLNRLRSGADRVLIRAGAGGAGSAALPSLAIEGHLQSVLPSGAAASTATRPASLAITWTRSNDVFESQPDIQVAGDYRVRVQARDASGSLGEAEAAFSVESPDLESIDPLADLTGLRQLADATSRQGGAAVPIDQLGDLFDRFAAAAQSGLSEHIERRRLVADNPWPWLVAFVAFLAVEWVIRRRSGLV